jgi:hypothetical protein
MVETEKSFGCAKLCKTPGTTLRFHLTPVRMAIIKGNKNKCW